MITAEKLLLYLIPTANELLTPQQYNNAINSIKEYAKQLLSDYTDKIVENAKINVIDDDRYGGGISHRIDKESITNQLPEFLKTIT